MKSKTDPGHKFSRIEYDFLQVNGWVAPEKIKAFIVAEIEKMIIQLSHICNHRPATGGSRRLLIVGLLKQPDQLCRVLGQGFTQFPVKRLEGPFSNFGSFAVNSIPHTDGTAAGYGGQHSDLFKQTDSVQVRHTAKMKSNGTCPAP
jgi:hypothetical protein